MSHLVSSATQPHHGPTPLLCLHLLKCDTFLYLLFLMGQSRPLFVYFRYFLDTISIIQIEKSEDGVLGNRTRGRRMVGADETMELWRPPFSIYFAQNV